MTVPPNDAAPTAPDDYLAQRLRRFMALFVLMVLLIVTCEVLASRYDVTSPLQAVKSFFLKGDTFHAVAVSGVFFVYLTTRPPRRQILFVVVAGLVLEGLRSILLYRNHAEGATLRYNIGVCGGLLSLVFLAAGAVKHRRTAKGREALIALITGLILPGFVAIAYTLLDFTHVVDPLVRDHYVYVVDGSLGFQPSFVLGQLYAKDYTALFRSATGTVYAALPAVFALMYWIDSRGGRRPPVDILVVFIIGAIVAAVLYHALPVIGPAPVFKKAFPDRPPVIGPLDALKLVKGGKTWRNCMPSMHATWALLVWWQAQPHSRLIRALAFVFVSFTFLAMLGYGHHFLTDIVVSFPYAMAIRALCVETVSIRAPERVRAIAGGTLLTCVWFIVIRAGSGPLRATFGLTWVAFAVTIAATVLLHRALARKAEAAARRMIPAEP